MPFSKSPSFAQAHPACCSSSSILTKLAPYYCYLGSTLQDIDSGDFLQAPCSMLHAPGSWLPGLPGLPAHYLWPSTAYHLLYLLLATPCARDSCGAVTVQEHNHLIHRVSRFLQCHGHGRPACLPAYCTCLPFAIIQGRAHAAVHSASRTGVGCEM